MSKNTGGPAFPLMQKWEADSYGKAANTGYEVVEYYAGMTLRDYFAAKALQGLVSSPRSIPRATIAEHAYLMADAMITEREKEK